MNDLLRNLIDAAEAQPMESARDPLARALDAIKADGGESRPKYNGWTNWETWNTNLWMTNDEGLYAVARSFVADETYVSEDDIEAHGDDAKPSLNVYEAAQAIREWWEETFYPGAPDELQAGPVSDAWSTILGRVNWEEIAEGLAEE